MEDQSPNSHRGRAGAYPAPLSSTVSTIAYLGVFGALGVAYLALAWQQVGYGLEYDEAINLTVLKNLAEGHGYATTGISDTWHQPFDPGASTGPALLLPGALAWKLTSGTLWAVRLVPLLYFAVLLASLGWLFTKAAGRWAGLVGVAAPLVISVSRADIRTESLVPGRYVGEFAAAACTALMVALLYADKPLLAGLAGGLALQSKVNFAVPVAIVALVWLVGRVLRHDSWARRLGFLAVGMAIPLVGFELFRLAQLGPDGYVANISYLREWLSSQAPPAAHSFETDIAVRLGNLAQSFSAGGAFVLIGSLVVLVATSLALTSMARTPAMPQRIGGGAAFDAMLSLLLAGVAIVVWWTLGASQNSPRVGLPGLLLGVPVVMVAAFMTIVGWLSLAPARRYASAVALVGIAGAGILVLSQANEALTQTFGARLLAEQRGAAAALSASGTPSLPNTWPWNLADLQILTGIPSETKPSVAAPTVAVFTSTRAWNELGSADARAFKERCGTISFEAQAVLVCSPTSTSSGGVS